MPALVKIYLHWLLGNGRYPVLGCMLLLTVVLSLFAVNVPVEQDTRSMSASRPAQTADHERFLDLFGNDEELFLSVTHPQLLPPKTLDLLTEVTRQIKGLAGVRRVLSLSNARQLVSGRYGAEDRPLLPAADDADSVKALQNALRAGLRLVGPAGLPDP